MSDPYFIIASSYEMRGNGVSTVESGGAEHRLDGAFDHAVHERFGRKRHLDVDLRELRLAIGAQILVAEAAHDLHVAIHPGNHQDLLEDLRRLRQREELAGVHAARHEVVARAFGRRPGEDRRLDLEEALGVEVAPRRERDLVAQDEVALELGPAQVEIAVAQPRLLGDRRVFVDRKWRRLRLVENRARSIGDELDLRPSATFGLTVSADRASTWPSTATTNSGRTLAAASAAGLPARTTTWVRP